MDWTEGGLTCIAFFVGAVTSILCGYLGMKTAVYANARTAVAAGHIGAAGWTGAFNTAFRAGGVMGFALCSISLLMLLLLLTIFRGVYGAGHEVQLMEAIAGYGLGGSTVAMFGRVGGGIYTKAADVGADLAGKVVHGIPEDDPRNPATVADNVGDNVGGARGRRVHAVFGCVLRCCAAGRASARAAPPQLLPPSLRTAGGYIS